MPSKCATAKRITRLCWLDRRRFIFGSEKHDYALHPWSSSQIATLERQCGCPLPPEFVAHLADVGTGVGPYYGLLSLEEMLEELEEMRQALRDGDIDRWPFERPFPYTTADLPRLKLAARSHRLGLWFETASKFSLGGLTIAEQGCGHTSVLVVAGELAGTVWDRYDNAGQWAPARRAEGRLISLVPWPSLSAPPTFAQWFDAWVEVCEVDVVPFHPSLARAWWRRLRNGSTG